MLTSSELLITLSNAVGAPGSEDEVRAIFREQLAGVGTFSADRLGSIVCCKPGATAAPRVMLAGHLDEVGLIVRYITHDGFIKFHHLGGWWSHVLLAQHVIIKTATGDVPGVIGAKPAHHLTDEERKKLLDLKEMFIDVGAKDKQEACEVFGIRPGDPILPATQCAPLRNPRLLCGKAFDDRAGVALVIEALQRMTHQQHPNTLYGVGTVQEEVGTRGAETAADEIDPDVAIVLEGTPADDLPGMNKDEAQGVLGRGPQIRFFDPTMITNRKLAQLTVDIAQALAIPYQVAIRTAGGTDAQRIHLHRRGVPTIVIGVPVRYAHSHVGVISLDDYEYSLRVLMELLLRLDIATVTSLTEF